MNNSSKRIYSLLSLVLMLIVGSKSNTCGISYPLSPGGIPQSIAFSPDGSLLATADGEGDGQDDSILLFKVKNGVLTGGTPYNCDCDVGSVAFSPGGALLAAGAGFGTSRCVYVFTVNGGSLSGPTIYDILEGGDGSISVVFSPDGSYLATVDGSRLTMFNVVGNTLGNNTVYGLPSGSTNPQAIAFSPDGSYLATANLSNDITLFHVSGGSLDNGTSYPVSSLPVAVAFSPNGLYLATADVYTNTVTLYLFAEGTLTLSKSYAVPSCTGVCPVAVAFSPNGSYLAAANDGPLGYAAAIIFNVTDVLNNGTVYPLPANSITPNSVTFSPDSSYLATANESSGDITMFNVTAWCNDNTTVTPTSVTRTTTPATSIPASPATSSGASAKIKKLALLLSLLGLYALQEQP